MLSSLPVSVRSLIVVLGICIFTFVILKPILKEFIDKKESNKWLFLWFSLVVSAFLIDNFWVILILHGLLVFLLAPKDSEGKITIYFFLLCVIPNISLDIPGILGIKKLFEISYNRILIIILLLPLLSYAKLQTAKIRKIPADTIIFVYVAIICLLSFRNSTVTNSLRESFVILLSIYIPFYVISRCIQTKEHLTKVFIALLFALTPLAVVGVFETARYWHLYQPAMTNPVGMGQRSGVLRASAVFLSPIVLGYAMTIAFGLFLYLRSYINSKFLYLFITFSICLGLLATVSRGPWIGFAILILAYIFTGPKKMANYTKTIVLVAVSIPIILLSPYGENFIELLPFVGSQETGTISYRERLFQQAWIVFQRNPFLGSATFLETPEMESMRWGGYGGIIDLVNNYVQISLASGVIGLALFLMFFISLLTAIFRNIKRLPKSEQDMVRMGRALFAIITSILLMIATVSDVDYIPILYWAIAGLAAAYIRTTNNLIAEHREKAQSDLERGPNAPQAT